MIVVAVIAGLAAVAIPSWIADSRRGKYDPEISAMFSEISTKEEAYKSEIGNGSYLSAPLCPAAVSPVTGQNFNTICVNPAGNWNTLRVNASDTAIRCTYVVTVGAAGSTPAPPAGFSFFANPAGAWYYMVATCDMDNNAATTNATFFQSSVDTKLQKLNYGQ